MSISLYRAVMAILAIIGTGGSLAHGAQPAPVPANVKQVVIVFKTHFDIGYTDLAVNIVGLKRGHN